MSRRSSSNSACGWDTIPSTSINFPYGRKILRQLPSTFRVAGRPFVNFCQLYLWPGDLTSTSVNFLCSRGTIVNSVNFPCDRETRKRSSTFRAAVGHSINLGQLSLCPGDLPLSSINFSVWPGDLPSSSVNFPRHLKTLCKLPLTFRASRRTFINFTCGREIVCRLPSTLRVAERPSVNIHLLSVRPGDFPSCSVIFSFDQKTFRQLSVRLGNLSSNCVNFPCGRGLWQSFMNFSCGRETFR